MPKQKPGTIVMIAFATGSTTIECVKTKAEVIAAMNVPFFGDSGEPTEVQFPSITESGIKQSPRDQEFMWLMKNEMVSFMRKDVVFWSVAEVSDKPIVDGVGGIISVGR